MLIQVIIYVLPTPIFAALLSITQWLRGTLLSGYRKKKSPLMLPHNSKNKKMQLKTDIIKLFCSS